METLMKMKNDEKAISLNRTMQYGNWEGEKTIGQGIQV